MRVEHVVEDGCQGNDGHGCQSCRKWRDQIVNDGEPSRQQGRGHANDDAERKPQEGGGAGVHGGRPHQGQVAEEVLSDERWGREQVRLDVLDDHDELPQRQEEQIASIPPMIIFC